VWLRNSVTIFEKQFIHAALRRLPFVSSHLLPGMEPGWKGRNCKGIGRVGRGNKEMEGERTELGSRIFTLVGLIVEHSARRW